MTATLNTGEIIPLIGLGTWKSKAGEVCEAVVEAIRAGYRHIDCAYAYDNEAQVAEGIRKAFELHLVKREELFITSKLWNTFHHPDDVKPALQKSLGLLGLDYLDLYLIHWPHAFQRGDKNFPTDENGKVLYSDVHYTETWKALEQCMNEGLVRAIGLSNFNQQQIQDLLDNARIKPANLQIEINPYFSQESLVQFCHDNNITVTAYAPFGSPDRVGVKREGEPSILENEKLQRIAATHERSVAQIILRWLHQRGIIAIPKSVTPARIQENVKIYNFELSDSDMTEINSLNTNIRRVVPLVKENGQYLYRDRLAPNFPFNE